MALDKSPLLRQWIGDIKRSLGLLGQVRIFLKTIKKWGFQGYRIVREVEEIYESPYIGYGIIAGRKPLNSL